MSSLLGSILIVDDEPSSSDILTERLEKVPVIFVTGIAASEARRLVPMGDPKVRLVFKPVNWVMIEQAIYELLGEQRPLDSPAPGPSWRSQ